MDSGNGWLIPLAEAADAPADAIGGKARSLARLAAAGFRTPGGVCVTTAAYHAFVETNRLAPVVAMELGRKPLDTMRWEEVWDTALRIRTVFLASEPPEGLRNELESVLLREPTGTRFAVRSSAPAEDSEKASFAGLHESRVGLEGLDAVLEAVRVVWASLWSDAALLYRREIGLDPAKSAMAVLLQPMIDATPSGVAFARDPRQPDAGRAIVEAVDGPCGALVDGQVDPDRWTLERPGGAVIEWRPGERDEAAAAEPMLAPADLEALMATLLAVERHFGWPPDIEWTGRRTDLALLQARPIAPPRPSEDRRTWYLSLRPGAEPLARLCDRVENELIPELTEEADRYAEDDLGDASDSALARAIERRAEAFTRWSRIYWDEFIPLAHGVRQLGTYYDEAVRPGDPYEFVALLQHAPLAAFQRNERIVELAERVRGDEELTRALDAALAEDDAGSRRARLLEVSGGRGLLEACDALLGGVMDVCYQGQRLADRPDLLLALVRELARRPATPRPSREADASAAQEAGAALERRLLEAVGPDREAEACEVLRIARTSWRLRDDDNLLLGRIESQLLRAVEAGLDRLESAGRLPTRPRAAAELAPSVAESLTDGSDAHVEFASSTPRDEGEAAGEEARAEAGTPRQLVGQPAAPGLAAGPVRRVRSAEDLGRFREGDVLFCDAIQPTMTHLVPLAAAIIERRGGMLIHGAIIARELGIPCVNGVADAVAQVADGEWVSVDGGLGIVTIGRPEFDLEREAPTPRPGNA